MTVTLIDTLILLMLLSSIAITVWLRSADKSDKPDQPDDTDYNDHLYDNF